jgi:hypothetical protein
MMNSKADRPATGNTKKKTANCAGTAERTRQRVMRVNVVFSKMPKVRAWRGAVIEGVRGPAPIKQIISTRELMTAVLEEAKAALETWAQKYKGLQQVTDLRDVFAEIRKMKQQGKPEPLSGGR